MRWILQTGPDQTEYSTQRGVSKGAPATSTAIQSKDHQDITRQLSGTSDGEEHKDIFSVQDTGRPHMSIVNQRHGHPNKDQQDHMEGRSLPLEYRKHGKITSVEFLLIKLRAARLEDLQDMLGHILFINPDHLFQYLHGLFDITGGNQPTVMW